MKTQALKPWTMAGAAALLLLLPHAASGQTTGGPYQFYTLTPCRLVDSRSNLGATLFSGGALQNVTVKGRCSVPVTARAVVINLTGVGPIVQGFFAIWASGTAYSGTSTLNLNAGEPALANGAIVSLGTGTPDLSVVFGTAVTGTSHLVVDVVGYFQ
jgi:hypothetical protein